MNIIDAVPRKYATALLALMLTAPILGLMAALVASGDEGPRQQVSRPKPPGRTFHYHGRVVGPDGRPVPGARVYLNLNLWHGTESAIGPRPRAVSHADGRFQFTIESTEFGPSFGELWRFARVVAVARGFGAGGSDSDAMDVEHELTVRLARDDVPITGRILDLKGRPVAGATVHVESILGPTNGDLGPWIKAILTGRENWNVLRFRHLKFMACNDDDSLVPPSTITGADGRFEIHGVGRERLAEVRVEGNAIQTVRYLAITRPGPPILVPYPLRPGVLWFTLRPVDRFEINVPPSRPIVGTVRDADTGAPVVGATIQNARRDAMAGPSTYRPVPTKTDSQGRFRLTGMPPGKGNSVFVLPPTDRPYLPSCRELGELKGTGPLRVEFQLKRGVWVEGKVIDKATGRPLFATIRYAAARDNPHLNEAPGFREIFTFNDRTASRQTEPDGSYRMAVLPGKGIVWVQGEGAVYPALDRASRAAAHLSDYVPQLEEGHGYATVDVAEGGPPLALDFALDPGRQIDGVVLDPNGEPVSGARVSNRFRVENWGLPLLSERFTVYGLEPPRFPPRRPPRPQGLQKRPAPPIPLEWPRTLLFVHEGRQLAGRADVSWSTPGPLTVRLQPWCAVTGRLVDANGVPCPSFALRPQAMGVGQPKGWAVHWDYPMTGPDGRFRVTGLVPGTSYRLKVAKARGRSNEGEVVPPLKPGEERDIGDVVVEMNGPQ